MDMRLTMYHSGYFIGYLVLCFGYMTTKALQWTEFHGNEYTFYDNRQPWTRAKEHCESQGGHLGRFPNAATATEVSNSFTREIIWLDLNDLQSEGEFKYSDGSEADWMDWFRNEPSSKDGEDCVIYHPQRMSSWEMRDRGCDEEHRTICERGIHTTGPPTLSITTVATSTTTSATAPTTLSTTPTEESSTEAVKMTRVTAEWSTADSSLGTSTDTGGSSGQGLSSEVAVAVGVAVGVCLLVLASILLILCLRHRRNKSEKSHPRNMDKPAFTNNVYDEEISTASPQNNQEVEDVTLYDNSMYENWKSDHHPAPIVSAEERETGKVEGGGRDEVELFDKPQYASSDITQIKQIQRPDAGEGSDDTILVENQGYASWGVIA